MNATMEVLRMTKPSRTDVTSSKDAYVSIFENAVEGIFQTLPDGRYLRVNPALARVYGYDSPEDLMDNLTDIAAQLYVDPKSRTRFMQLMEDADEVADFQSEIRCKDGSTRWISENARAVRDPSGDLLYYEGFVVDITERKHAREVQARLEDELRQAQKMTALGALAGGIAHDLKTVLQIVDGYADLAREQMDTGDETAAREHLARISDVVERGDDLVDRIRAFGRDADARHEPVEVDVLLMDVIRMLQATLPPGIEIRQHIELGTGRVMADPSQIFQILINLCTNAFRAMGETGGVLHVGLRMITFAAGDAERPDGVEPGEYLELSVRDTGPGMDAATAHRVFEPFYSTKDPATDSLSGLGLAIVQGIVRGLGGGASVHSAPNEGTRFTLYLPVYDNGKERDTILARFSNRARAAVGRQR